VFELDDFNTQDQATVWELFRLKGRYPQLKATLFTLVGLSDPSTLLELSRQDWVELNVHGWDHYGEWKWNYWEARHFFEQIETMSWLRPVFKMPWNRWPTVGFIRALKEAGWTFATSWPKRYQAWMLRSVGIPTYVSPPGAVWCHPQDLPRLDLTDYECFEFVSEYLDYRKRNECGECEHRQSRMDS
jgi:hypothetical protein